MSRTTTTTCEPIYNQDQENDKNMKQSKFKVVVEAGRVTVIAPRELSAGDAERMAADLMRAAATLRVMSAVKRVSLIGKGG